MRGTLKVEIIKPESHSWDQAGDRLRLLTWTLGRALNATMSALFRDAVKELEARREGERADTSWQNRAEKTLRESWNEALVKQLESDRKPGRRSRKGELRSIDERNYMPVTEPLTAETVDNILARFTGDHLKDLMALQASFPSFKSSVAFFSRSRAVEISGSHNRARLSIPLWGQGKGSCTFVVAVEGRSARATWDRLVAGVPERQRVVELEKQIALVRKAKSEAKKAGDAGRDTELAENIDALEQALHDLDLYKLGRVGVKYDQRRRKWFALISWSRTGGQRERKSGQTAAVVYGVNTHLFVLAEDGSQWEATGADIIAARRGFQRRRKELQRTLNTHGKGSRGHGKARKYAPILKLAGKESRYVATKVQTLSADLAKWCAEHNVSRVVAVNMSGTRDSFEKRTGGEAHAELKRLIHNWPFYQSSQWSARMLGKIGIAYNEIDRPKSFGSTCPCCGHVDKENISEQPGRIVEVRVIDGQAFERRQKWQRFECKKCGLRTSLEAAEAAHLLVSAGANHSLEKTQRDAVKTTEENARGSVESGGEHATE